MFLDQQAKLNDMKMDEMLENAPKDTISQVIKDKDSVIEKLKKFKSDVIDALQCDDDLDDEDYISSIKEMEEQYDCFVSREDLKEEYFDKGWEQGKCDTWDEIEKATEALKEQAEDAFQSIAEALCGEGEEADGIAGWDRDWETIKIFFFEIFS